MAKQHLSGHLVISKSSEHHLHLTEKLCIHTHNVIEKSDWYYNPLRKRFWVPFNRRIVPSGCDYKSSCRRATIISRTCVVWFGDAASGGRHAIGRIGQGSPTVYVFISSGTRKGGYAIVLWQLEWFCFYIFFILEVYFNAMTSDQFAKGCWWS